MGAHSAILWWIRQLDESRDIISWKFNALNVHVSLLKKFVLDRSGKTSLWSWCHHSWRLNFTSSTSRGYRFTTLSFLVQNFAKIILNPLHITNIWLLLHNIEGILSCVIGSSLLHLVCTIWGLQVNIDHLRCIKIYVENWIEDIHVWYFQKLWY